MTRRSLFIGIGTALVSVVTVLALRAPLGEMDRQIQSAKYQIRGNRLADSSIVIVYIDDDAIASLGWPVRRNFYALMVKALTDLHVKAIGIEPVFEEPRLEYPEYDDLLATVTSTAGNVVLAGYFSMLGPAAASAPDSVPGSLFDYPGVSGVTTRGTRLHLPLPALHRAAAGVGHLNLAGNAGMPLFVTDGTAQVPAFALELLRLAASADRREVRYDGSELSIKNKSADLSFHALPDDIVAVNFPGPLSSFRRYPFLEVLRSYDAARTDRVGQVPVASFKDKVILVGLISEGRSQFVGTPVDARLPSIVLQAAFLDNALRSGFLRPAPSWLDLLLVLAAAFGCALAVLLLRSPLDRLIAFGVLAGFVVISSFLFAVVSVQLPVVPVLIAGLMTTVTLLVYKHHATEEQVVSLSAEKDRIISDLRDREAKVALLERELLDLEAAKAPDRTNELLEEIKRYKSEIYALSSRADDMEAYAPPKENGGAAEVATFEGIVYEKNGRMKPVVEFVEKIAASDAPVLILGESGTGKELVARALHRRSQRAGGPFIAVNCGALSESLLESELFGHDRGAFTGALKERMGRFELANGGTIFLDEIGEVSEAFQLKLLRVLQEGELERVGASKTIKVNVRVVAATNKELKEEVDAGRFREDLYYRLNVLTVVLPPLRDRKPDIGLLTQFFLAREADGMRISRNVMEALHNHPWRGNVRELESAVKRAVLMAKADRRAMVSMKDLSDDLAAAGRGAMPVQEQILESLREKGFLRSAISETADELGGLNRGTVAEYLRGECLKAFAESRFDLDAAVHHVSLSPNTAINDRVRKRIQEYLANIAEAVVASQPWEEAKLALKPKLKNLPQRYHPYLEQVAEAFYRGLWKQ